MNGIATELLGRAPSLDVLEPPGSRACAFPLIEIVDDFRRRTVELEIVWRETSNGLEPASIAQGQPSMPQGEQLVSSETLQDPVDVHGVRPSASAKSVWVKGNRIVWSSGKPITCWRKTSSHKR